MASSALEGNAQTGGPADHPGPDATLEGVEVIVVTYGRSDLVRRCLTSLREALGEVPHAKIHVVDNCSPDDTAEMVAREFPEVRLHRQPTNSGFSAANNVVLRQLTAPFVLILNPDTEIPAGVLGHLLGVMSTELDLGLIGCRLVTADGSFDHAAKRQIPSPGDALRYFVLPASHRRRSGYLASEVDEFDYGDVGAVSGAFMLIRTAAVRDVGLLDERYWMYGEDLDWCVRFRAAGWRVAYDGRVTAIHLKGGSSGRARTLRVNWHFHRSMLVFYFAHRGARRRLVVDMAVACGIVARFFATSVMNSCRRLTDARYSVPRARPR